MVARLRDIEEENQSMRSYYKERYLSYDETEHSTGIKNISDILFETIIEIDKEVYKSTIGKFSLYWGLMLNEKDEIYEIAKEANENSSPIEIKDILSKMIDKYFDIMLENNKKYIDIITDDKIEKEEIRSKISRLKNRALNYYTDKKQFLDAEKVVRKNNDILPSVCTIIWHILTVIDANVLNYFKKNPQNDLFYFPLTQEERDDLFGICIKGNHQGIITYENNECKLNSLNSYGFTFISNIEEEVINKYFDLLIEKNINYRMERHKFLALMNQFGDYHNLTEKELLDFAQKSHDMGYDISKISNIDSI